MTKKNTSAARRNVHVPRILVTNDDGIGAPGLDVLEKIALSLSDDVWVVAPEQEQSGASHSLTLHMPVRVRKISPRRFAVSGTPTDCVLMALQAIIPAAKKPALLLSGVNRGSNIGDDVTYSGTVAAAMEGTVLGVPSIALSQECDDDSVSWANAARHAPGVIRKLVAAGWPEGILMNVNFPACLPAQVKNVMLCPQGKRKVSVALSKRVDVKGRPYFWIGGERSNRTDRPDVDLARLAGNHITVTPLTMDLTDHETLETLRKALA